MAVHFTNTEFSQRRQRAIQAIREQELDGMLLFAPESHYYLTGYDTFGFAMFQCMVLNANGELNLLTRLPDLRQAQETSILNDGQIRIWSEVEGANPATSLAQLLADMGLQGGRLGIETKTAGLNAYNGKLVEHALADVAVLCEASQLIPALRRDKSAQEISYHRRAAELSDAAFQAALDNTTAGAFEGDILAAMQGAVFRGGGSYAGNEFVIGSGNHALLCRYQSAPRCLDEQDQLTLEWSGARFRYQAAMMRTLVIGKADNRQRAMHAAAREALQACEEAIKPGNPMSDVYTAHERIFDAHGYKHARLQACGYGMGAVFNPIWVDFPMFYKDNPLIMNRDNVYFLHMILMDSDTGFAMSLGHSLRVTDTGAERLSKASLDLPVL